MVGLLDWLTGGGDTPPKQPQATLGALSDTTMQAPILSYDQWKDAHGPIGRALTQGYGQLFVDDTSAQYAAYLAQLQGLRSASITNANAEVQQRALREALRQENLLGPDAGGGASAPPAATQGAPATAAVPSATSTAAAALPAASPFTAGGGGVGLLDDASAAAPAAAPGGIPLLNPQGAGGPGITPAGGVSLGKALVANLMLPGVGKEIYAKNFAGPTELARAIADLRALPPNSPLLPYYLQAARKAAGAQIENFRAGSYGRDPLSGAVTNFPVLGEGQQGHFDPSGNAYSTEVPGALPIYSKVKGIEQGAIGAREKDVAGNANRLKYGGLGVATPPGSRFAAGGAVGGASAAGPAPAAASAPGEPRSMPDGTIIPPVAEQAPVNRAGAYLDKALPVWAETDAAFNGAIPHLQSAEVRIKTISDALKETESGEWATNKAAWSAKLKALGVNVPPAALGSAAEVQKVLKENASLTLDTLKGYTNRFTQMEFDRLSKNIANADLQPEANQSILGEALGQVRYGQGLANSWAEAKKDGWQDPVDYQRAFSGANPLQRYVDNAKKEIGPLKGMAGGPGSAPKISVGATATGPGGAKVRWSGTAWEPMNGR